MERFDRLFRDAERIKPAASTWRNIAANSGLAGLADARDSKAHGWRMAAALAIGLGVLSGLFMVVRGPMATADRRGGAGDTALASASVQGREESGLLDPELLNWHADLGEESATEWESDPLMPEVFGQGEATEEVQE